MKNSEISKRLKKIGYIQGTRTRHYTIWNCSCENKLHPVGVGNHPSRESYFKGYKKQLGPHLKDFGKI